LLGVSRAAVSKVGTAYKIHGKASSAARNSDRKPKLSEKDRRPLKRIVSKNHRTTAAEVTAELDSQIEDTDCIKTARRELHKSYIHGTAAFAKPLITEYRAEKRKRWCDDDKKLDSDEWNHVPWSDESSFMLFPISGRVYVWRAPKEVCNPKGLVPTVTHGGGFVMSWAMSWYSAGPIITLNGRITASDYVDISGHLSYGPDVVS